MRGFGIFSTIAVSLLVWWERLISIEWVMVILSLGWESFLWLGKGVLQLAAASVILLIGQQHILDLGPRVTPQVQSMSERYLDSGKSDRKMMFWPMLGGDSYWAMEKEYEERGKLIDKDGHDVIRECREVVVKKAEPENGAYAKPSHGIMGIGWSTAATRCKLVTLCDPVAGLPRCSWAYKP